MINGWVPQKMEGLGGMIFLEKVGECVRFHEQKLSGVRGSCFFWVVLKYHLKVGLK